MDKLIELLQQIQDLAGVAIEALQGASEGAGGEGAPPEGGGEQPPADGSGPPEGSENEPPAK